MTTVETGTLRERALAALGEARRQQEEEKAASERAEVERLAEIEVRYLADFQAELDKRGFDGVVATGRVTVVEGVPLRIRYQTPSKSLVACAPCATCEDDIEWTYVHSLADFGYVLTEWFPAHAGASCQRCEDRTRYLVNAEAERKREEERVVRAREEYAALEQRAAVANAVPEQTVEERFAAALYELLDARYGHGPF